MPELPEVETFRYYFNHTSLRKKIEKTECKTASLIKKTSCTALDRALDGKQFSGSSRKGKFLIARIAHSDYKLIFHFGMTGSLKYGIKDEFTKKEKKYAQLIITFANAHALLWINIRKFGRVYLVKDINEISTLKNMGPDALEISKKEFLALLKEREKKNIKSFLMDQKDIGGIGNEYSNEILFQASIDPHKKISSLDKKTREILYSTMRRVLKKAIELRKTHKQFPSSWLSAHKKDKKCPKHTKHTLKKETIAGRSALYCLENQ